MNCELLFLENLRTIFGTYETLDIFKQELFARERRYAIGKDADNDVLKDPFFTGHSLLTHSQEKEKSLKPNSRPGNCVYCDDKKHICSRYNVIIWRAVLAKTNNIHAHQL